jgi:G:T-mismatch repair DNA endonuclease (very short patch repair protein)
MLEKYGHAQYANWEKTKQTWASKSDEEKDKYAKEASERQRAFSPEKRAEINARVTKGHLEKYGVACPANLGYGGYSAIASSLFEIIDDGAAQFRPKNDLEFKVGKVSVDFCRGNQVIEFFGDYWHANPSVYMADHVIARKKKTAKQIQLEDAERIAKIEAAGYQVKIVWEREYRRNPEKVIQECKEFLNAAHEKQ